MDMSTRKRTITERSPEISDTVKKSNLNITPTKLIQTSLIMATANPMVIDDKRKQEYEKIVARDAPGWFKGAFKFLFDTVTEDLHKIDFKIESVNEVKKQCSENSDRINKLQDKIIELETENRKQQQYMNKLEMDSRKTNLILRGVAETGPTEVIEEVINKFLRETLNITETKKNRYINSL